MWLQQEIHLAPQAQGFHLIFRKIEQALPGIRRLRTGLLQVFIQHATASLPLNENAGPTVPQYFKSCLKHNEREDESKLNSLRSLYLGGHRNQCGVLRQSEVQA